MKGIKMKAAKLMKFLSEALGDGLQFEEKGEHLRVFQTHASSNKPKMQLDVMGDIIHCVTNSEVTINSTTKSSGLVVVDSLIINEVNISEALDRFIKKFFPDVNLIVEDGVVTFYVMRDVGLSQLQKLTDSVSDKVYRYVPPAIPGKADFREYDINISYFN